MSDPRAHFLEQWNALGAAFVELLDGVRGQADELVDVAKCELEREAVRKLIRAGRLKPATIGRRRYVRRSALLALVDEISVDAKKDDKKASPQDLYARLVSATRHAR